ncbi:MAG: hypothetical protein P8078_06385 [bacterium]|jgi:hypothetical protein
MKWPPIKIRPYFSRNHIESAAFFTRKAYDIEKNISPKTLYNSNTFPIESINKHRYFITSAIINSIAFLEATINELYSDIHDKYYTHVKGLDKLKFKVIQDLWDFPLRWGSRPCGENFPPADNPSRDKTYQIRHILLDILELNC